MHNDKYSYLVLSPVTKSHEPSSILTHTTTGYLFVVPTCLLPREGLRLRIMRTPEFRGVADRRPCAYCFCMRFRITPNPKPKAPKP